MVAAGTVSSASSTPSLSAVAPAAACFWLLPPPPISRPSRPKTDFLGVAVLPDAGASVTAAGLSFFPLRLCNLLPAGLWPPVSLSFAVAVAAAAAAAAFAATSDAAPSADFAAACALAVPCSATPSRCGCCLAAGVAGVPLTEGRLGELPFGAAVFSAVGGSRAFPVAAGELLGR